MIRVKFKFRYKGGKESKWDDEAAVSSLETAEEEIKALIEKFNQEEITRYGKGGQPREFVQLVDCEPKLTHTWDKVEMFSGAVQSYRCKNCQRVITAHFMDAPIRNSGECHPKRVCVYCNREFKTEANCKRHKAKFHS